MTTDDPKPSDVPKPAAKPTAREVYAEMNQAAAIIVAGGLIAGAIVLTNHWEVIGTDRTLRLNRWTGTIVACGPLGLPPSLGGKLNWELPCPSPIPLGESKGAGNQHELSDEEVFGKQPTK
jgi:hypothetical protein